MPTPSQFFFVSSFAPCCAPMMSTCMFPCAPRPAPCRSRISLQGPPYTRETLSTPLHSTPLRRKCPLLRSGITESHSCTTARDARRATRRASSRRGCRAHRFRPPTSSSGILRTPSCVPSCPVLSLRCTALRRGTHENGTRRDRLHGPAGRDHAPDASLTAARRVLVGVCYGARRGNVRAAGKCKAPRPVGPLRRTRAGR